MPNKLNELKENPKDLFDFLYDYYKQSKDTTPEHIIFFQKNNIFDFAEQAITLGCDIFHVEKVISIIGAGQEVNSEKIISYYKALHSKNNNYYPLYISSLFSKIIDVYPSKWFELFKAIKKLEYSTVPSIIFVLIADNKNLKPNEKYKYAIQLINSNCENQYKAGYGILENCVKDASFSFKNDALELLKEKQKIKQGNELKTIIRVICNLSLQEVSLQPIVIEIKLQNDADIDYIISQFLFLQKDKIAGNKYLRDLFLLFNSIKSENEQTFLNLDLVLEDLFEKNFDFAFEFLKTWIIKSDYKSGEKQINQIWNSSLSKIDNLKKLPFIYTTFFLDDEAAYHHTAADIIKEVKLFKKRKVFFDKETIENCNYDDIIFLCRKTLGYVFYIEPMCELFDSILVARCKDKKICALLTDVFNELAKNYSFPVVNYFKEKLKSDKTVNIAIYKKLLNSAKRVCKKEKRKDCPELKAPYDQLFLVSRRDFEYNTELRKNAEKDSVLLHLVSRVFIKYGKGTNFYYDGKNSGISIFKEFKSNYYLSQQDVYSPVDAEIIRERYKMVKRGEK